MYFPVLLIFNAVLSYCPFDLPAQLELFFFGIAVPFFFALRSRPNQPRDESEIFHSETFSKPSRWIWMLFLAGALLFRFYRLGDLAAWPLLDEGKNAFFGMELSRHWSGRLFYDICQMPPFSYWVSGLFFKVFTPSLTTLWLLPAFISLAVLPIGYGAARFYFSKSFSLLFLGLLGLSLYPVYVGRFNLQAVDLLFWEMAVFLALGRVIQLKTSGAVLLLGLCVGAGFYIHFAWALVALGIGLLTLGIFSKEKITRKLKVFGFLGFSIFVVLAPLLWAAEREGFGSYIRSLFLDNPGENWGGRLYDSLSYVTVLFWGSSN